MRQILPLIAAVLVVFVFGLRVGAVPEAGPSILADFMPVALQDTLPQTIESLDQRLQEIERTDPGAAMAFVLPLFAFFCALWAQNTGRNPWLWFFLGLIFSIITAFVVLHKNSMDLHTNSTPKTKPKS